jgi:predicted membrane metal-binding protein
MVGSQAPTHCIAVCIIWMKRQGVLPQTHPDALHCVTTSGITAEHVRCALRSLIVAIPARGIPEMPWWAVFPPFTAIAPFKDGAHAYQRHIPADGGSRQYVMRSRGQP